MKKVILLIIVAVFAFAIRNKTMAAKREKLVGTWMMEQAIPGGQARAHINLKPTGEFYVVVDAVSGERTAFGESFGKWESTGRTLKMTFTRNGIPGVDMSRQYGGVITSLDDKSVTYKSVDGVETWRRAQ